MAVDYGAGTSSAIAAQYADLRSAIASKGEAENRQKARDIERKGLFGTGIKSSDIQDFGNIAIKGAEFGEKRMGRKMDRATKSFDRRQAADERRLASLQKRADLGDADALTELKGIQSGMTERRNSFEDFMGKYQEKGLWGTKFGGEDVGYRTEGESKYSQAMRPKPGSGGGSGPDLSKEIGLSENPNERRLQEEIGFSENPNERAMASGTRPPDRYSSYPQGREFENIAGGGMMNLGGREDERFGIGGKKKDDLVSSVSPTSGGMAGGPPQRTATSNQVTGGMAGGPPQRTATSNKFTGGPPRRDNYRRALPDALAQAGLSAEERAARDVAEKQGLIKEKEQALGQNELEQKQMIEKMLAERRRNKLTEALRETDWN